MIGRNYAPDFNGAHLQGVQCDSLEGFKLSGVVQGIDTLATARFFERAASTIKLTML
jgi:hypothetical protein